MYAEKLYKNGKFYTMEQEGQAVEAVGVRDGKIVFTGTNEEAEKIESDEIIDIKGRAVFPGFIDCHQHRVSDSDQPVLYACACGKLKST